MCGSVDRIIATRFTRSLIAIFNPEPHDKWVRFHLTRRQLLANVGYAAAALPFANMFPSRKTHIVTLSFDDGFKKSFFRTAEIYESFGLRGCFNVIAKPGENWKNPIGNIDDWNRLKERGHEVMAHTYDHTNLTEIPLAEAKRHIDRCADYFEKHLHGFKASESVYNFAYNASNPDLDNYALTRFLVVRTQGNTAVNPIPTHRKPVLIGCWSQGPENGQAFLDKAINDFLASPGGWFVYNTHGLDEEGWGPIGSVYLDGLLKRLTAMPNVEVLPAGEVVLRLRP